MFLLTTMSKGAFSLSMYVGGAVLAFVLPILLGIFVITLIIAVIVKIVGYLNGKPITTPNKRTRKLLLVELGLIVLCALIALVIPMVSKLIGSLL